MTTTLHSLLANMAVIAIVISIWTQFGEPAGAFGRRMRTLFLAALMAGGTVTVMALPFEVREGVFADLRATMIVLSCFFGGPVVGAAAWAAGASYRVWVGGVGAPSAIVTLSLTLSIGLIARRLLRNRLPNKTDILLIAVISGGASVSGFLLLPVDLRNELFPNLAITVGTLNFVAITVAGLTLLSDQRRRETIRQNELYAAIIDALPDPLNAKDLSGRFIAANPATAVLMKLGNAGDLIGNSDFDFYPNETAARFKRDEDAMLEAGKPLTTRQPVTFLNGSTGTLSTMKAPLRNKAGDIVGIITHNRDISERLKLEAGYEESQRRLAEALTNMADALAMFDQNGCIVMCNPQYAAMFPKTAQLRVPGANLRDILRAGVATGEERVPPRMTQDTWIEDTVADLYIPGDREIQLSDGRWLQARVRPADDGTSLTVISDITAAKTAEVALQETNARLDLLAKTDGLTRLINRRTFDEMLNREQARSARSNQPLSVLMIDVDHFKAYNDTYGHQRGDECLRAIAECLRNSLKRPGDVAARYGGEEFVAQLADTGPDGALLLAEGFRQAVGRLNIPHTGSPKGRVSVTIGVATYAPGTIESPALLVRRADEALYAGKAGGRDRTEQSRPEADDTPRRVVAG